jgi:hypothetical protein
MGSVFTPGCDVSLDVAVPDGQTVAVGERRPHLVDVGFEAVFHAHDTLVAGCRQRAEDAAVARHVMLLRSVACH